MSAHIPPTLTPSQPSKARSILGFANLRIIVALIIREMTSTYGKSAGGFLWVIIEPIAGIVLMTWIFSLAFRAPPLGTNFPVFYATGIVPFLMFFDVVNKLAHSIKFSRQLLSYPVISHVHALSARFLLNTLTQLLVGAILMVGITMAFAAREPIDMNSIGLAIAMIAACSFAVGTTNCFLFNMFPLWERVWAIVMRPMFIISSIFFLFDDVPEPYSDILWYNPIIHFIGALRRGFYSTYDADFVSPTYVFGLSAVLTTVSLVFLNRFFIEFRR